MHTMTLVGGIWLPKSGPCAERIHVLLATWCHKDTVTDTKSRLRGEIVFYPGETGKCDVALLERNVNTNVACWGLTLILTNVPISDKNNIISQLRSHKTGEDGRVPNTGSSSGLNTKQAIFVTRPPGGREGREVRKYSPRCQLGELL